MTINFKKLALLALTTIGLGISATQASVVFVRDNDGFISLILNGTPYSDTSTDLAVRIGSWNSGTSVFTLNPVLENGGYFSADLVEIKTTLAAEDNSVAGSAGSPFAVAIYSQPAPTSNATLASIEPLAVLTDSLWVLPTFSFGTGEFPLTLGSNTTAVRGSYNFNGGNQIITLVPEPSTGSLLMIGAAGLVALRRLRKV